VISPPYESGRWWPGGSHRLLNWPVAHRRAPRDAVPKFGFRADRKAQSGRAKLLLRVTKGPHRFG